MSDAVTTVGVLPEAASRLVRTPVACRLWMAMSCTSALVLPLVLDHRVGEGHTPNEPWTACAIILASVMNVEIGRALERGAVFSQRPHKALSAWAFVSAIVLSVGWVLPVVAVCYAHARWRGLRVPLWKWVGSASFVVLAGMVAAVSVHAVLGENSLTQGDGLRGMCAVLVGTVSFLAVETVLFHGIAYLNDARDETWLRETLRHLTFYLTESGVLLVGGLSAAVFTASPWFLALLLPVFVLAQRAALHEPLRQRAEHDDKTGLLRYEAWERQARTAAARCTRHGKPWSVLFVDLDHFKQFNDVWGHLAGDHAIEAAARVIGDEVRSGDLVARFGGEEFCVFLPATGPDDGLALAERIRAALASTDLPGAQQLTASVGLASRQPCGGTLAFAGADADALDLADVVRSADRALYAAKESGRNTTRVRLVS